MTEVQHQAKRQYGNESITPRVNRIRETAFGAVALTVGIAGTLEIGTNMEWGVKAYLGTLLLPSLVAVGVGSKMLCVELNQSNENFVARRSTSE